MPRYAPLSFHATRDCVDIKLYDVDNDEIFHMEVEEAPQLWTTTDQPSESDAASLMTAAPLKRLKFQSFEAASQFIQSYGDSLSSVYGHPKLANAVYADLHRMRGFERVDALADYYTVKDFDIETEVGNGFPDVNSADMPINMIAVFNRRNKSWHAMTTCSVDRKRIDEKFPGAKISIFNTEAEMLMEFAHEVSTADVIAGWNIIKFDVPYVLNRVKRICGLSVFRSFSPFGWVSEREFEDDFGEKVTTYTIKGVHVLDLQDVYKKFVLKPQTSYSLENISQVELKAGKLKHESGIPGHLLYRKYPTDGLLYNMVDVQRCTEIDLKKGLFALVVQIANVTRSNLEDSMFQTRMWTNLIYWKLSEQNIFFQIRPEKKMPRSIEGGWVQEPIKGMHEHVVSVDLTSSYPSHMIALNMSPETKGPMIPGVTVERWLQEDLTSLIPDGFCMAPNGQCFRNDKIGKLVEIVLEVFMSRKADKKVMMRLKDEAVQLEGAEKEAKLAEANLWDIRQNGWKVTGNSCYGAFANKGFLFYDPDVAEAITAAGRFTVRMMGAHLSTFITKNIGKDFPVIIYMDTDSNYLNLNPVVLKYASQLNEDEQINWLVDFADGPLKKATQMSLKRIGEMYHAFRPDQLAADREAVCRRGLWVGKKKYVLSVSDMEGIRYKTPEIKTTGLSLIQSGTPAKAKVIMKDFMETLVGRGDVEGARKIAIGSSFTLDDDLDEVAEFQGVSDVKSFDLGNGLNAKGTSKGPKAALAHNRLIEKHNASAEIEEINGGDKIKILPLRIPNPAKSDYIGWKGDWPAIFDDVKPYINFPLHYEKKVLSPLDAIFKSMNMRLMQAEQLDLF